jgi:hypothetical protein
MEGTTSESIKTEDAAQQVMSPMGLTQAPLTNEEVAMLVQYRQNQQRVASVIPTSEVPLPRTPTAVSLPAVSGYRTVTIPDALAESIFGQISQRTMQDRWNEEQRQHERVRAADRVGLTPELKAMFDANQPVFGLPTIKQ